MHLFTSLNEMCTAIVRATHSHDLVRRHGHPVLMMEAGRLEEVDRSVALAEAV